MVITQSNNNRDEAFWLLGPYPNDQPRFARHLILNGNALSRSINRHLTSEGKDVLRIGVTEVGTVHKERVAVVDIERAQYGCLLVFAKFDSRSDSFSGECVCHAFALAKTTAGN